MIVQARLERMLSRAAAFSLPRGAGQKVIQHISACKPVVAQASLAATIRLVHNAWPVAARCGQSAPCPLCGAAGQSAVLHVLACASVEVWPLVSQGEPPTLEELLFVVGGPTDRMRDIMVAHDVVYTIIVAQRHRLTRGAWTQIARQRLRALRVRRGLVH